jgi:hypothetical protein
MRVGKEEQINQMLREAKTLVSVFDEIVSSINEKEINSYRATIKKVS